jgi:hypothetical protein
MPDTAQPTHPATPARWYPEPPPRRPEESDEDYAQRLTKQHSDRTGPYDHRRSEDCAQSRHSPCVGRLIRSVTCRCPCHAPASRGISPCRDTAWFDRNHVMHLGYLYDLPTATAHGVLCATATAAHTSPMSTVDDVRVAVETAYQSPISRRFTIHILWILGADTLVADCPTRPTSFDKETEPA